MSSELQDARDAIDVAKDYAKRSMHLSYWRDVHSCEFDDETGYWKIVFEASPATLSPWYRYEITVDSKTGAVKKAKRIEE